MAAARDGRGCRATSRPIAGLLPAHSGLRLVESRSVRRRCLGSSEIPIENVGCNEGNGLPHYGVWHLFSMTYATLTSEAPKRPLPSSTRAAANTPAEPIGARVARFPAGVSFPRFPRRRRPRRPSVPAADRAGRSGRTHPRRLGRRAPADPTGNIQQAIIRRANPAGDRVAVAPVWMGRN